MSNEITEPVWWACGNCGGSFSTHEGKISHDAEGFDSFICLECINESADFFDFLTEEM